MAGRYDRLRLWRKIFIIYELLTISYLLVGGFDGSGTRGSRVDKGLC